MTKAQICRSVALFALVAGLSFNSACSSQRRARLHGSSKQLRAKDYDRVLETWSRKQEVHRDLDSRVFVHSTYHSVEFRRAFAAAFPDIYGHGGEITRRELVELTGDVEQHHNFFMAVYTPDPGWNDLEKEDSIWRLSLKGDDGLGVEPDSIIPIDSDANLERVYPYINRFTRNYLVRFPLLDGRKQLILHSSSEQFELTVASAVGRATLEWGLIPDVP